MNNNESRPMNVTNPRTEFGYTLPETKLYKQYATNGPRHKVTKRFLAQGSVSFIIGLSASSRDESLGPFARKTTYWFRPKVSGANVSFPPRFGRFSIRPTTIKEIKRISPTQSRLYENDTGREASRSADIISDQGYHKPTCQDRYQWKPAANGNKSTTETVILSHSEQLLPVIAW
jgi:hypothetical protein